MAVVVSVVVEEVVVPVVDSVVVEVVVVVVHAVVAEVDLVVAEVVVVEEEVAEGAVVADVEVRNSYHEKSFSVHHDIAFSLSLIFR